MTSILDLINEPKDIKQLDKVQINVLIRKIREKIIKTISKTGGHLASSLGVVDLTVALHYVFDSPSDKIIFDVGHQCYAHKIITGRREKLDTIRQYDGISGFPKPNESEHDAFGTGHSSTSISAALGIATARDLKQENYKVIAVIGDGSLNGGMAFEALNQAGHLKTNMIVVLNDNKMSISPNVGALSSYLRKMVTDPFYHERREKAKHYLNLLPSIGTKASKAVSDLEETLRAFTTTPGLLFKEMGFHYFGPVDGHDVGALIKAFRNIKGMEGPVLLHVVTKKGYGYKPAERNKTRFHGVGSFNIENGEKLACHDTITYTESFSDALIDLAGKDDKIVGITAAMASGTGLDKFQKKFPSRFFDVGIAEQHAVTFAAGLASQGLKPVVAIYSTFLQRGYDQIVHDVCLQNLPVVFCIDRAGLVGEDGPTHHGSFDISYLRHIPNLVIMAPKDENELKDMLYTAFKLERPVAIRYPRGCGMGVKVTKNYKMIKSSEVLKKGRKLAVVAAGPLVYEALESKLDATVVNARFVKPLDEEMLMKVAKKHKKIVTVEENSLAGGFGSAVVEFFKDNKVDVDVERMGIPDRFVEQGAVAILKNHYGLNRNKIKEVGERLARK